MCFRRSPPPSGLRHFRAFAALPLTAGPAHPEHLCLIIKGEKQEEKEEKKKDYYLHERSFGSFERSFRMPEGVDTDKIEANFKKGVLTVKLPKTAEAQKAEKKVAIKAA